MRAFLSSRPIVVVPVCRGSYRPRYPRCVTVDRAERQKECPTTRRDTRPLGSPPGWTSAHGILAESHRRRSQCVSGAPNWTVLEEVSAGRWPFGWSQRPSRQAASGWLLQRRVGVRISALEGSESQVRDCRGDHEAAPASLTVARRPWRLGQLDRVSRRPQRVSWCPRSFQVASATSDQGCAAERRPRTRTGGRFVLPSCWPQRSSRSCPCSRTLLLCVQPGTVWREEEYYAIAGSA